MREKWSFVETSVEAGVTGVDGDFEIQREHVLDLHEKVQNISDLDHSGLRILDDHPGS